MKIREINEILESEVVIGQDMLDLEIISACGCDLMSDLLAFVKESCVLLTGQVNLQVIKTAEMLDLQCIVFVRGKQPTEDVCALANEAGMVLLKTEKTLFAACGILYRQGLKPC